MTFRENCPKKNVLTADRLMIIDYYNKSKRNPYKK